MAVNFPNGIYSVGQGIFSSSPYRKLMDAKKKAKDEAFSKYYEKLNTQVNTQGVRDVDLLDPVTGGGITKDIDQWTSYGIQNKDAIAKGGVEKLQFERMQREILNRIQQSKNALKFDLDLGKAKFEKKYDPNDDDMEVQRRVGKSIYDPEHYQENFYDPNSKENHGTPFSWENVSPVTTTFTPDEKKKFYSYALGDAKREIDPATIKKDFPTKGFQTYDEKYSDIVLKNGADKAANEIPDKPIDYEGKRRRKTYNALKDDAYWLEKADPLFQKYYGRSIQTPKDAAAADFLLNNVDQKEQKTERMVQPRVGRTGGPSGTRIWDAYSELQGIMQGKTQNSILDKNTQVYTPINDLGSSFQSVLINSLKKQEQQSSTFKAIEPMLEQRGYVSIDGAGNMSLYIMDPNNTVDAQGVALRPPRLITRIDRRGLLREANPGTKNWSAIESIMPKTQTGTQSKTRTPTSVKPKSKKDDPLGILD